MLKVIYSRTLHYVSSGPHTHLFYSFLLYAPIVSDSLQLLCLCLAGMGAMAEVPTVVAEVELMLRKLMDSPQQVTSQRASQDTK